MRTAYPSVILHLFVFCLVVIRKRTDKEAAIKKKQDGSVVQPSSEHPNMMLAHLAVTPENPVARICFVYESINDIDAGLQLNLSFLTQVEIRCTPGQPN